MNATIRPLAVVTGASSGIGLELARECAAPWDTGVTVTCLMPGATETEFFKRADMMDTKVGTEQKMDAGEVARIGFKAMIDGEAEVVAGMANKLRAAAAGVMPSSALAEQHRKMAEPGTAKQ